MLILYVNCVPKLVWDFPRLRGLDTLIKFYLSIYPTDYMQTPGMLIIYAVLIYHEILSKSVSSQHVLFEQVKGQRR